MFNYIIKKRKINTYADKIEFFFQKFILLSFKGILRRCGLNSGENDSM